MIDSNDFIKALKKSDIDFVTGVPDSLLKDVCACITNEFSSDKHIIATNEGSAVALAMGHYLSSGNPALVYMQNSGLGNSVNPITSLAAKEVYAIPMVLMIGWRGEILENNEQIHDEPQHVKQGQITPDQLELLGIPYIVIKGNENIIDVIERLKNQAIHESSPVALLVRKNTFSSYKYQKTSDFPNLLSREEVLNLIVDLIPDESPVVSTTGKTSRELFEIRRERGMGHEKDFLTVGGMGHASQIATGIALTRPDIDVYCVDGDGALLMHTGALAISAGVKNLKHIVINNGAHDSVGGQPTKASNLNLTELAKTFGYNLFERVDDKSAIITAINKMMKFDGSSFLEIRCKIGARIELGRPDRTPRENKNAFMDFLKS